MGYTCAFYVKSYFPSKLYLNHQIYNFAKINNLIVIEDATHAFGTKFENKLIGSMGDVTCFSFDGIKNITSGEGGCIVTDNKKIIDYISDARLLGVERDSMKRYQELVIKKLEKF